MAYTKPAPEGSFEVPYVSQELAVLTQGLQLGPNMTPELLLKVLSISRWLQSNNLGPAALETVEWCVRNQSNRHSTSTRRFRDGHWSYGSYSSGGTVWSASDRTDTTYSSDPRCSRDFTRGLAGGLDSGDLTQSMPSQDALDPCGNVAYPETTDLRQATYSQLTGQFSTPCGSMTGSMPLNSDQNHFNASSMNAPLFDGTQLQDSVVNAFPLQGRYTMGDETTFYGQSQEHITPATAAPANVLNPGIESSEVGLSQQLLLKHTEAQSKLSQGRRLKRSRPLSTVLVPPPPRSQPPPMPSTLSSLMPVSHGIPFRGSPTNAITSTTPATIRALPAGRNNQCAQPCKHQSQSLCLACGIGVCRKNLTRHLMHHCKQLTGDGPFTCLCGKKAHDKEALASHYMAHYKETIMDADYCKYNRFLVWCIINFRPVLAQAMSCGYTTAGVSSLQFWTPPDWEFTDYHFKLIKDEIKAWDKDNERFDPKSLWELCNIPFDSPNQTLTGPSTSP